MATDEDGVSQRQQRHSLSATIQSNEVASYLWFMPQSR
jgi:hypothetical protein